MLARKADCEVPPPPPSPDLHPATVLRPAHCWATILCVVLKMEEVRDCAKLSTCCRVAPELVISALRAASGSTSPLRRRRSACASDSLITEAWLRAYLLPAGLTVPDSGTKVASEPSKSKA